MYGYPSTPNMPTLKIRIKKSSQEVVDLVDIEKGSYIVPSNKRLDMNLGVEFGFLDKSISNVKTKEVSLVGTKYSIGEGSSAVMKCANIKPKVKFIRRVMTNGKTKFIKILCNTDSINGLVDKPISTGRNSKRDIMCSSSIKRNKFIHKQLMGGKVTGVEEALREGGSLAYFNFEGICSAAENGKIAIFKMIFEKLDYSILIDRALGVDLYETASEEGHDVLASYLSNKIEGLRETIENENLDGLDNYK